MSLSAVADTKITLTGNPFVDNGLAVIAALADCRTIDELTLEKIRQVHKRGSKLARDNNRLSSTFSLYLNSPLTNQKKGKDNTHLLENYAKITTTVLESIGKETVNEYCDFCGNPFSLDLSKVSIDHMGRHWFPLSGSMGSDAQALPTASRGLNSCATCLLAVQYLGYAVFSLHGRLVLLTSTSISLWYRLVRGFVEVTRDKLTLRQSDSGRVPTLGTKKDKTSGTNAVVLRLLAIMRDMKLNERDVEKGSVSLWMFNNGKSTDCDIERIPNDCLRFLQKCAEDIGLDEISQIVKRDKSKREYSLLDSIIQRRDYLPLYYSKKYGRPGASSKLFGMYQTLVLGCSPYLLCIARKIAEYIKETSDNDKLGIDLDILYEKQISVKKIIVKMVEDSRLTFDEYYNMFILSKEHRPWKLVKYYLLTDTNGSDSRILEQFINISNKDEFKERVTRIARLIFDSYIRRRGLDRFKKEVLDGFKRGNITRHWLRQQFERLATENETFDIEENWKNFDLEINGNFYNLQYLLRLLFISLVSQHL